MREERLASLFRKPSNEDVTTRLLGGVLSYDHVSSMEAKLDAFASRIGELSRNGNSSNNDSIGTSVNGDAAS